MKKLPGILCLLVFGFGAAAQLNEFAVNNIPDSLKKKANVVVREEIIKFAIKDINTARYDVHQVYTLMNEQGKAYLNFSEFSYKFRVLDDASIKLYDQSGKKINSYTKKEMTSLNYGDGLVPEGKLTFINITPAAYPVTVEINYTIKYRGLFSYPGSYFQVPDQSVQNLVFEVEAPSELSFRYKLLNNNLQPLVTRDGNKELYHWEVKNLPASRVEQNAGSAENYLQGVLIAPNKFQLDEYEGDMTSWKNFGSWLDKLYAKTNGLPPEKQMFYRDMVKNASTDRDKAAILYNYMQNNMRYVSIQLGIGGLRPFPASFVDDKKYGDCKALSNYLRSALDAVGVRSNIVIIQGGLTPRNVPEDFPANYFNHAILCIPQPKDTIWLECTSTTLPFAQLGPFTENRKALLVTDNGGYLVNTPLSNYKDNTESIHTVIEINEAGGAKVKVDYTLNGFGRDELLMSYHDLKADEKRNFFLSNMEWKQPDDLEISNSKIKDNPYLVSAQMDYQKMYAFNAGNKLFFDARLYPIFKADIPENDKRERDYYFTAPYQSFDTTVFKFPAGYTPESIPKNKLVKLAFAQYTCNYSWDAEKSTLTAVTLLQVKDRVIKAADYRKLVDFKKQVMADMNEKIVMKKG